MSRQHQGHTRQATGGEGQPAPRCERPGLGKAWLSCGAHHQTQAHVWSDTLEDTNCPEQSCSKQCPATSSLPQLVCPQLTSSAQTCVCAHGKTHPTSAVLRTADQRGHSKQEPHTASTSQADWYS